MALSYSPPCDAQTLIERSFRGELTRTLLLREIKISHLIVRRRAVPHFSGGRPKDFSNRILVLEIRDKTILEILVLEKIGIIVVET